MSNIDPEVKIAVNDQFGFIEEEELLNGMGFGRVFRVKIKNKIFVLKQSPHFHERKFYEHLAPKVISHGINTPELFASGLVKNLNWILIDYIAHPLPPERWRDDEEVIQTIERLHRLDSKEPFLRDNQHLHNWDDDLIETAIKLWSPPEQRKLRPIFEKNQKDYQREFRKDILVSGDPNGKNWRLDGQGNLYLIDWERVGLSDPATDLMAIAFGEGEDYVFDNISKLYLSFAKNINLSIEELSRKIKVGRVHIVLKITRDLLNKKGHIDARVREFHRDVFPLWLMRNF